MPVYNEQECVKMVIDEWNTELQKYNFSYTLCLLNDGSKDNTLKILEEAAHTNKNIKVVDKANSGHGQTCIYGYKLALESGANFVFQIDSDGQCDPKYFENALLKSEKNKVVYGYRRTRDDGTQRFIVSRFVSLFALVATGQWVKDANVPYRLMHKDTLTQVVDKIPKDFHLANILVSVLQQKHFGISWVPIHFRDRMGGVASVKTFSFVKHGLKLFKQLRAAI
jgi:dolichol-phosphate mannosyltransferase